MRFWPFILLIFVSCGDPDDYVENERCLSCHFFLGKKGDDNYLLLQENVRTQKMKVVFDSIENINWQRCDVFFKRKNAYFVLSFAGYDSKITSFQSEDELLEYCNKNKINAGEGLPSSSGMYEMLAPRIACE